MGLAESKVNYIHSIPASMDPHSGVPIFRNGESVEQFIVMEDEEITCLYSLFYKTKQRFPDSNCLGTKTLISGAN